MSRLFIAIRPPEAARDALLRAQDDALEVRWQDDAQLHCTLAFLGDVREETIDDLGLALLAIVIPPFAMEVRGVGHFERKGAPSALWAAVPHSEPLDRLQRKVTGACRLAGVQPDRRTFRPHITLARVPRSAPPVGAWLAANALLTVDPWRADRFVLFESRLSPAGAEYETLMEFRLF